MLWAHTTERGRADEVLAALGGAGQSGIRGAAGQRCLGVRALGLDVKGARCLKCETTSSSQWGRALALCRTQSGWGGEGGARCEV